MKNNIQTRQVFLTVILLCLCMISFLITPGWAQQQYTTAGRCELAQQAVALTPIEAERKGDYFNAEQQDDSFYINLVTPPGPGPYFATLHTTVLTKSPGAAYFFVFRPIDTTHWERVFDSVNIDIGNFGYNSKNFYVDSLFPGKMHRVEFWVTDSLNTYPYPAVLFFKTAEDPSVGIMEIDGFIVEREVSVYNINSSLIMQGVTESFASERLKKDYPAGLYILKDKKDPNWSFKIPVTR